MSYEKELAAAKKAVALAASLSRVSNNTIYNRNSYIALQNIIYLKHKLKWILSYKGVQKTLMQSEVWTKSDKTPVTAADYGLYLNVCIPSSSLTF